MWVPEVTVRSAGLEAVFSFQIRKIVNAFAVFLASVWVSVWACIFISQGIELLSNQSDGLLRAKDIRIERRYISLIFFLKTFASKSTLAQIHWCCQYVFYFTLKSICPWFMPFLCLFVFMSLCQITNAHWDWGPNCNFWFLMSGFSVLGSCLCFMTSLHFFEDVIRY